MDYKIIVDKEKLKEIQVESNYEYECWICKNKFYNKYKMKTPICSACSIIAKCIMCGKRI